MYILFINSGDKCDIFFSPQFNNNSNKKKIVQPMGSTRPNLTHVGWVESFLTHHGGLGQKNPSNSTQPDPCTPLISSMLCYHGD